MISRQSFPEMVTVRFRHDSHEEKRIDARSGQPAPENGVDVKKKKQVCVELHSSLPWLGSSPLRRPPSLVLHVQKPRLVDVGGSPQAEGVGDPWSCEQRFSLKFMSCFLQFTVGFQQDLLKQ
jgi:hypothetical protein